jgi:hypothetical protein
MGSIHEKTRGKTSRATVPLRLGFRQHTQIVHTVVWPRLTIHDLYTIGPVVSVLYVHFIHDE